MIASTNYAADTYLTNQPVAELVRFLGVSTVNIVNKKLNKLNGLKNDIGDELFYSLSDEDKDFILRTEGSVDLGYKINLIGLREIERTLREDYEY